MSTLTFNYHWVKPTVGGDSAVWGTELNGSLDAIDSQVFAAANNIWPIVLSPPTPTNAVPIGSILIWGSESLFPTSYVQCDGSIYNIADMPHLFAVISNTFGGDGVATFAVPPLTGGSIPTGYAAGGGFDVGEEALAAITPGGALTYLAMNFIIRFE